MIILPYGFSSSNASTFGFWNNLVGIAGVIFCSILLAKYQVFKRLTIYVTLGSFVTFASFFMFIVMSPKKGYSGAFASILFNGFINVSIQGFSLEYCIELAPEFGEAVSGGISLALANVLAFFEISYIQMVSEEPDPKAAMRSTIGMTLGCLLLASVLMMFVNGKKAREI